MDPWKSRFLWEITIFGCELLVFGSVSGPFGDSTHQNRPEDEIKEGEKDQETEIDFLTGLWLPDEPRSSAPAEIGQSIQGAWYRCGLCIWDRGQQLIAIHTAVRRHIVEVKQEGEATGALSLKSRVHIAKLEGILSSVAKKGSFIDDTRFQSYVSKLKGGSKGDKGDSSSKKRGCGNTLNTRYRKKYWIWALRAGVSHLPSGPSGLLSVCSFSFVLFVFGWPGPNKNKIMGRVTSQGIDFYSK